MDASENPFLYIQQQWRANPLELLVPAAAGVTILQLAVAYLVFLSASFFTFALCLALTLTALARTAIFLNTLLSNSRRGVPTELLSRDFQLLLGSLIASVAVYAFIGPNARLGLFFALMSLPLFLFLTYLVKRYVHYVPTPEATLFDARQLLPELRTQLTRALVAIAPLRTRALSLATSLAGRVRIALPLFRKNPDFRSS